MFGGDENSSNSRYLLVKYGCKYTKKMVTLLNYHKRFLRIAMIWRNFCTFAS